MTPWQRLPDENMRWYARFEAYRLAGPNRSILSTYNAELAREGKEKRGNLPSSWSTAANKFNWAARAEAWDIQEQSRITAEREAYLRSLSSEFDAKYRYLYEEAVKAWLKSLEDSVIETQEAIEGSDGNGQRLKVSTRREGQSGNPALLAQAGAMIKAIREMFGVDASTKTINYNYDLSNATDDQLRRIAAGDDPAEVLQQNPVTGES